MPLPRVALMSTGMAVGPPARPGAKGGYDPLANYATRTMRGDPAKDQMHSLLFPDRPNKPPDMAVPASQIDTYGTSLNHPFHQGGVDFDRAPDVTSRLSGAQVQPPQPLRAGCHAGKTSMRSESVVSVLTGRGPQPPPVASGRKPARTEYEQPTYRIGRDMRGSEAKDALYPVAKPPAPAPQPQPQENDPMMARLMQLKGAYDNLAAFAAQGLPRDADGNTDERFLMHLLAEQGVELSLDGFAELLARCDISPDGFPDFRDFVSCANRPHRETPQEAPPDAADAMPPPPPQQPQPAAEMMAFGSAGPTPDTQAATPSSSFRYQLSDAPVGGRGGGPQSAAAAAPEKPAQTWRSMQVTSDMVRQSMPLGMPRATPLGLNVRHQLERPAALSNKFSSGFNADHYL